LCPGDDVPCSTCSSSGCGNALPDDSRLEAIRWGVDPVFGCGEIEFALARTAQRASSFDCPVDAELTSSGGWQGSGGPPCGGEFSAGEVVVRFQEGNVSLLRGYVDGSSNYSGPGLPPPGFVYELRGTGGRALAGLLTSVGSYLATVLAEDTAAACRPYRVILIADGAESCGLDEDAEAAAAELAGAGVPVHVVGLSVSAPGEIAALNALASAGGTDVAVFVDEPSSLEAVLLYLMESSRLEEVCNGVDDDCDGEVDEECTVFRDGFDCSGRSELGRWSQTVP